MRGYRIHGTEVHGGTGGADRLTGPPMRDHSAVPVGHKCVAGFGHSRASPPT